MTPDTIANSIISIWDAFLAGLYPSLSAIVATVILVWFAAKFFYRRQIATLKERDSTKDERLATRDERLALMLEKLEAAEKAREAAKKTREAAETVQQLFDEVEKAVKRDATERREDVSTDVATTVSATSFAMHDLREKQAVLNLTIRDVLTKQDIIAAYTAAEFLSADDLKRILTKDT